jgi:hypothetical protein
MPEMDKDRAIRERAYFMWEREGRPDGRAQDHWLSAITEQLGEYSGSDDEFTGEEEKVLAGRPDAGGVRINAPATVFTVLSY